MSEYQKLLDYLEHNVSKPKQKEKPIKKEETIVKEVKKPKLDLTNYKDIQFDLHDSSNGSKGFSVEKLKTRMRNKLLEDHRRIQKYERPYFSVTELLQCHRSVWYSRLKYPIDEKDLYNWPWLHLIFKVGNVLHDIVQELYFDDKNSCELTLKSEKYKVKGRLDAIENPNLYELKTIDPPKLVDGYLEEHYKQGLIYGFMANEDYGYNVDTIVIVYILRTLRDVIPYDVPYDFDRAKSLMDGALELRRYINENKVSPPVNATKESCNYCLYKKYCKKEEKIEDESVFLI